jgi:hypothetical protein
LNVVKLSHLIGQKMSKTRATTGIDGRPLPILPPERDARVWARLVRVLFYTPGFMGLLLIKTGEPASFGITVELLMLASAAAIVGGLFIGAESTGGGADTSSKVGTWSGGLVIELLAVVPFLCALPGLFHELATSTLLHSKAPTAIDIALGASELLPAVAILPFMIFELSGFGTLGYVVNKTVNWAINAAILCLIVATYASYREGEYKYEKHFAVLLVVIMAITVVYGVMKLRRMQTDYDARCPVEKDKDKDKEKVPK